MRALKAAGLAVSVDSAASDELRRGAEAGADFLLSLTEHTLDIARDTGATPVLIPASHGDLASLLRAAEAADKRGIAAILDPILDPIHFGFMASLQRYAEVRRALPQAEILMGTGNLTELTDADSGGVTAMLLGICSELAHPQHPGRAGQPAHPPHDPGARRRAAHDVRRPRGRQPAARLRRRAAASCTTARRFRTRRRRLPSWRRR